MIGLAIPFFPAATGALAPGLSDKDELTDRVARNESFTHFGNACFAVVASVTSRLISLARILYAAAVFASGMAGSVLFIRNDDISHEAARQEHFGALPNHTSPVEPGRSAGFCATMVRRYSC